MGVELLTCDKKEALPDRNEDGISIEYIYLEGRLEDKKDVEEFSDYFSLDEKERNDVLNVIKKYPGRANPEYTRRLMKSSPAVYDQFTPDKKELEVESGLIDSLDEDSGPLSGIVHRYPDRILFMISRRCANYCRFCTRKRMVGKENLPINNKTARDGIEYIKNNKQIRDVILSGGDALMLKDSSLEGILKAITQIEHIDTIRLGTRIPSSYPMRVTEKLVDMFRIYNKEKQLYGMLHFNHIDELTPESRNACKMLASVGLQLECQTVLLKGVNDNYLDIERLFRELVKTGVTPYHLYVMDMVKGAEHFRTTLQTGLDIMEHLRDKDGLIRPHYVLDLPRGKGKAYLPQDLISYKNGKALVRSPLKRDELIEYSDPKF